MPLLLRCCHLERSPTRFSLCRARRGRGTQPGCRTLRAFERPRREQRSRLKTKSRGPKKSGAVFPRAYPAFHSCHPERWVPHPSVSRVRFSHVLPCISLVSSRAPPPPVVIPRSPRRRGPQRRLVLRRLAWWRPRDLLFSFNPHLESTSIKRHWLICMGCPH